MAGKLVEYARMDLPHEIAPDERSDSSHLLRQRSQRFLWAIGLVVAVVIMAVAFGAYRQPELLMDLVGLRYCG
ncbi:MAG: hypothetical protein K9J42_09070 [Sulfuritalea sp.]|nr:hypothetical protein [Sulfuritalea sp.]